MSKKEVSDLINELLKPFGSFISPIVYLAVWFLFLKLSSDNIVIIRQNPELFLSLSFLVYVFLLIIKSTTWSIGHTHFGLKGDSRARLIGYHKEDADNYWFDLFADNPELLKDDKVKDLIEELITNKDRASE